MDPVQLVLYLIVVVAVLCGALMYLAFGIGFVQDWSLAKRPGHPAQRLAAWMNSRARGSERRMMRAVDSLRKGAGATPSK